jgi:lipopolysaccharide transport system ATP-binding protein
VGDPVIRADKLSKRYRIGSREPYRTLRDTIMDAVARPFRAVSARASRSSSAGDGGGRNSIETIDALKDVSFEVMRGEAVGIIGHNGAGKSTLLKILSRITDPTGGWAEVNGRVGSLLEVGTGFHPELTGRENIYLNGSILGMRRSEIEVTFDEIVGFAGVEQFLDTPVKHYSSGMYTRLAFSVAAHLRTEILLVDEVLAVGDAIFQLKCLNRMSEVVGGGKTILFVSHNLEAITRLCRRAILLRDGQVETIGTPEECVDRYLVEIRQQKIDGTGGTSLRASQRRGRHVDAPVMLSQLLILDEQGLPTWSVPSGGGFTAVLSYEFAECASPQNVTFAITFSNIHNHRIASCRSHDTHLEPIRVERSGQVLCRIPRLPLAPGSYKLSVGCNAEAGFSDGVDDAATIEVTGNGFYPSGSVPPRSHGEVLFGHEWDVLCSRGPS